MDYIESRNMFLRLYSETNLTQEQKQKLYTKYIDNIKVLAYNGDAQAQYDLAQHYEDVGFFGNPSPFYNSYKRLYWYFKSSENNNGSACNNLADLIERGDGCRMNLQKAKEYYKKSMELGDPLGKENYYKMLQDLQKGGIYNP